MNVKKWLLTTGIVLLCLLLLVGGLTVWVDPLFHYHGPMDGWAYALRDQRYVTDGILRHFDYNAIIIGSSMAEQFKASQADELFGVNTVKVPLSGTSYKEVNERLERAFRSNQDIQMVIRCLYFGKIASPKDEMGYSDYPDYLYDDNPFNDVYYVLNKDILANYTLLDMEMTSKGYKTVDFDAYSMWIAYEYGKDAVLSHYERKTQKDAVPFSEEDEKRVAENLYQNVISSAEAHPETDFYLFFSPYSIVRLDGYARDGKLQYQFDAEKYAASLLLPYENVHLFSFWDAYDVICNLDNYKDTLHYGSWINDWILDCMATGEHELTIENFEDYYREIGAFYSEYDYDKIFEA